MAVIVEKKGIDINEGKGENRTVPLVTLDFPFQMDLEKSVIEKARQAVRERGTGFFLVIDVKFLFRSVCFGHGVVVGEIFHIYISEN